MQQNSHQPSSSRQTIAVIVTNYNYGRFLQQAIESVLTQSRPADKVIVVDDGSTDETIDVLARYERKLTVLRQSRLGQGAAINQGLRFIRCDIVTFLDSDDYWAPERLELCDTYLREHPQCGYLHHPFSWVDVNGRAIRGMGQAILASGAITLASAFSQDVAFAPTSCMVIRRRVLDSVGPIPESIFRLRADFFLQTIAPHYTNVGTIEEPLTAYRIHGANGYSGQLSDAKLRANWQLTTAFVDWIDREIGTRVDPLSNFAYVRSAIWILRTEGNLKKALNVLWGYFRAMDAQKVWSLKSIFRVLYLCSEIVEPRFASWLFNRLTAVIWRR